MSYIFWKGNSLLNGETIILALTGVFTPSGNRKTGPMIQSYILKYGIKPTHDRKSGAFAICGNCPLKEACYVGSHYLDTVYDGSYRSVDRLPKAYLRGKPLRLGAYGDPAAIPTDVWKKLLNWTNGFTGYTHQWKSCDIELSNYCLASVESKEEMEEAWALGWKTYRVGLPTESPVENEMFCPHYNSEPTIQCLQCQLCSGLGLTSKKGIFVYVHGHNGKKKAFQKIKNQKEIK